MFAVFSTLIFVRWLMGGLLATFLFDSINMGFVSVHHLKSVNFYFLFDLIAYLYFVAFVPFLKQHGGL